jgi:DNA-binding response OmpR family regulator
MLTSRTGMKYQQLAYKLGATGYLTKPYLPPQLLENLDNILAETGPRIKPAQRSTSYVVSKISHRGLVYRACNLLRSAV